MKYKLTNNIKQVNNITLYQIKALTEITINVKKGDLGGWIESEKNLSQEGSSWVSENAWVSGEAKVYGNAQVFGNAQVCENARIYENAVVSRNALVYENARVFGNALVYGNAKVSGNVQIYGNAKVSENHYVKFSKLLSNITDKQNIGDSIRVQCNLGVSSDELGEFVIGFKHVLKTDNPNVFKSKYDPSFLYEIGKVSKVENPDLTNSSCSSGLHFSHISFWENQNCNSVIMVKCYLKDIITVQEGKIRCKELDVIGLVKNGVS